MNARKVRLGMVCDFIRGVTFDKADATTQPEIGKTPVLRAGNIGEELDAQSGLVWVPDALVSVEQRLRQSDIAICMSSGSPDVVGKTARVPSNLRASIGSFCGIIRPKSADEATYLSFFFRSATFRRHRNAIARGANIQNLRFSQFEEIELEIPGEQRRIAVELEHADRLRRMRIYALKLTDTFLPAAFVELFRDLRETASQYEQTAFGDSVEFSQLGLVRGATEMHIDYPYAYLRMDSIVGNGQLVLNDLRRVKATADEVEAFKLHPGDFLFNTRNSRELVGKTALYTQDRGPLLFNNNIMRIRFKPWILPEFMLGLFQTDWLKRNLERIKSGTTSVFAIYYKDLAELPIVVPPPPLQRKFAALAERVQQLRAVQREALRQAEHLFASLLHSAFPA